MNEWNEYNIGITLLRMYVHMYVYQKYINVEYRAWFGTKKEELLKIVLIFGSRVF